MDSFEGGSFAGRSAMLGQLSRLPAALLPMQPSLTAGTGANLHLEMNLARMPRSHSVTSYIVAAGRRGPMAALGQES